MLTQEEDIELPTDMFAEPVDFRPPSPKPSMTSFQRSENAKIGPQELVVHLPPKHSLWAHRLWNAGKSMTNYLDSHPELYLGKNVLELGAAASLPSIVCAINGAKHVISTDYPDPTLLRNIEKNAQENIPDLLNKTFFVRGFIWGRNECDLDEPLTTQGKFDLILLADLIFNHSQHENLLKSCQELLAPNGVVLTTYSHHVVKWAYRDNKFFEIAQEMGFECEKIIDEKWDPMFPDDVGDLDVRRTVHGWTLRLP
jgi:nicotinamide N-methyltransferase